MATNKFYWKSAFTFLILWSLPASAGALPETRQPGIEPKEQVLAVLPFVSLDDESQIWLSSGVASFLRHNLQRLRYALVPPPAEVSDALSRCGISITEEVERVKLDRFREMTLADTMIFGAIGLRQNKVTLKIKVLALDSTKKVQDLEIKGSVESLNMLLQEATAQIASACKIEVTPSDRSWMIDPGNLKPTTLRMLVDANRFYQEQDSPNAIRSYRELLEKHPGFAEAYLRCAEALWAQKKGQEAASILKEGIEIQPQSVDLPLLLAEIYLEEGKMEAAKAVLDSLLLSHPMEPHAHLYLARIYREKELLELALDTLENGIRTSSRKDLFYLQMARIQQQKENILQALKGCEKALQLFPGNREALALRGILLGMSGDYDQAVQSYRQAMTSQLPPDFLKQNVKASTPAKNSPQNRVIEEYLSKLRQNPTDASTYNQLAAAYEDEGRYEEAFQAYREAIRINPTFGAVYFNWAAALVHQGKLDEAIPNYLKSIELDPKHAASYENLAQVYAHQGNWKKAEQIYLEFEKKTGNPAKDRVERLKKQLAKKK